MSAWWAYIIGLLTIPVLGFSITAFCVALAKPPANAPEPTPDETQYPKEPWMRDAADAIIDHHEIDEYCEHAHGPIGGYPGSWCRVKPDTAENIIAKYYSQRPTP